MDALQRNEEAELRGLMFSIAYHMTGSVAEAEDLVQDAFFRLERARQTGVVIETAKAYLATTTTRLAIDHMRSARVRRESYVGTWLPEPIVAPLHESPEQMAELSDSLSMAFLVLLESLSPVERAVFLSARDFRLLLPGHCADRRQERAELPADLRRARQHLDAHQPRYEATTEHSQMLLRSFLAAVQNGDLDQLVNLLAADAVFCGDGGGKATAIRQPLYGQERIATFILAGFTRQSSSGDIDPALVNGGPGLIAHDSEGKIVSVLSLEVLDGVTRPYVASSTPTSSSTSAPYRT